MTQITQIHKKKNICVNLRDLRAKLGGWADLTSRILHLGGWVGGLEPEALADAVESRVLAQRIHRREADERRGGITLGGGLFKALECGIDIAETAVDLHQRYGLGVVTRRSRREFLQDSFRLLALP